MEDLLLNIVKEATGSKLQNLKQAAQIAHGNEKWNIFMITLNSIKIIVLKILQINFFGNTEPLGMRHMSYDR